MNLRSVDLNLLVVLDALLEEAHVSRAAERLGLSQPATSSALDRCRALFRDPLLERGRGTMRPTPKAEALRDPLRALLASTEAILDPPAPDLATLSQTIRIVMADLPAAVMIGALHARLADSAPGLNLVMQPWHGAAAALDGLAKGTSDLALSVFPELDAGFRRQELSRERYVVLMRRGHPASAEFGLDAWLAWPHILVSGRGEASGPLDRQLARQGRSRRVALVVPSFLMVPALVRHSDLIAMLPERCLPEEGREAFEVFDPPLPVEGFPLHLAWHLRRDHDPAVQHVAALLRQLLAAWRP